MQGTNAVWGFNFLRVGGLKPFKLLKCILARGKKGKLFCNFFYCKCACLCAGACYRLREPCFILSGDCRNFTGARHNLTGACHNFTGAWRNFTDGCRNFIGARCNFTDARCNYTEGSSIKKAANFKKSSYCIAHNPLLFFHVDKVFLHQHH